MQLEALQDDPRSSPPSVGESQGFALVVHSVRPLCEGSDARRSGASDQIGTDDSSPEGCRRRARHCGRRSHQKSDSQDDRPAVGPSGAATAPFQCALSTRSGCQCIAHALQAVTELVPEATITTIDGISAFESMSRRAILLGLDRVAGGRQALPFVRLFHSEPSAYLWEDDAGTVHTIHQGEGGEQGDPLMPLLFSLGQHASLEALQRRMRPTERLMAYLDDIYFASKPERVGDVVAASVQELWAHARIRVHGGKTHIWNRAGTKPQVCRDNLKRRS